MLFVNSDKDPIFPMDANERVIASLERTYSLFGAGEQVDSLVSIGGHDYRKDIRQAAFRFINSHLKNDSKPVTDSEVDLVVDSRTNPRHPIAPDKLRVFPNDADIPKDELNTTIDRHFVPIARVGVPAEGAFESWKRSLLSELRRVTFRSFPERIPAAKLIERSSPESARVGTEPGIEVRLRTLPALQPPKEPKRILLVVTNPDADGAMPSWIQQAIQSGDALYFCDSRGVGETRWTRKNPPNYVARSHVLLGRTVEDGRVWDIAAVARHLREAHSGRASIHLVGEGNAAVLAAYAALLEPDIEGLVLHQPPLSHMESSAPALLNVLRVCDVPDVLGMLAPRSLTVTGVEANSLRKVTAIYREAGAASKFTLR
jgi:hypothetical protein